MLQGKQRYNIKAAVCVSAPSLDFKNVPRTEIPNYQLTKLQTSPDAPMPRCLRAKLSASLMLRKLLALVLILLVSGFAADEFTLYELLPPETHQFAITYDVTATREGAQFFFNPIRP